MELPTEGELDEVLLTYKNHEAGWLWGFYEQKELVGIIGVMRHSEREWEIAHLVVEAFYRKQGIGKRMITALRQQSSDLQLIWAEIDEKSIGFFEKCGFRITPIPHGLWEKNSFRCEWR